MPPSCGAEGTHGRGEADSYSSYSYTPYSEESEEERCLKQTQRIGEKRQRSVHLQSKGVPPNVSDWSSEGLESSNEEGDVSESSTEEEASPKESACKSGKRQRLHHSAVAESSCSEGMEEERKAPAARELVEKAKEALARAKEALALAEQAEKAQAQASEKQEEEARREKERQKEKEARAQAREKEEKEALREKEREKEARKKEREKEARREKETEGEGGPSTGKRERGGGGP